MYERVSIALRDYRVSIFLRLATLSVLGGMAWFRLKGLEADSAFVDFRLLFPMLAVVALSFFNLAAEAAKYRVLFGSSRMSFANGFQSVLAGMSVGIWTPNRIGEFAGRLRYAPISDKTRSVAATITGSTIQGTITVLFGLLGFCFFDFQVNVSLPWGVSVFLVGLFAVVSFFFFGKGWISKLRRKHFTTSASALFRALMFGVTRYAIFSTQFVILLFAFGFDGSMLQAYSGVFLLYAVQSYIPGSFLSELGVREVLSVFLFVPFFADPLGAPMAAFCLWLINIGLPIASWSFVSGIKKVET